MLTNKPLMLSFLFLIFFFQPRLWWFQKYRLGLFLSLFIRAVIVLRERFRDEKKRRSRTAANEVKVRDISLKLWRWCFLITWTQSGAATLSSSPSFIHRELVKRARPRHHSNCPFLSLVFMTQLSFLSSFPPSVRSCLPHSALLWLVHVRWRQRAVAWRKRSLAGVKVKGQQGQGTAGCWCSVCFFPDRFEVDDKKPDVGISKMGGLLCLSRPR